MEWWESSGGREGRVRAAGRETRAQMVVAYVNFMILSQCHISRISEKVDKYSYPSQPDWTVNCVRTPEFPRGPKLGMHRH